MTESTAIMTTGQAGGSLPRTRLEADGHGVMAVVPRSAGEAASMATSLALAGMVPDSYRVGGKSGNEVNVSLVAAGILKGLEIGLPPQTALGQLLPLNGRFSLWGDGMWATVQRYDVIADHRVEWLGPEFDKDTLPLDKWPNEYGCRVSIWRKGQKSPYVGEFTVRDARRASLWNSGTKAPWRLYPDRMLFNRARAFPLRDGFADCLFGLAVAEEQMDSYEPRRAAVDNSALNDDLTAADTRMLASPDNLRESVAGYRAALAAVGTLEGLQELQTRPDSMRLMEALRREDAPEYERLIAENAARFKDIEDGEARAAREADEQAADQAEADEEEARAARDEAEREEARVAAQEEDS